MGPPATARWEFGDPTAAHLSEWKKKRFEFQPRQDDGSELEKTSARRGGGPRPYEKKSDMRGSDRAPRSFRARCRRPTNSQLNFDFEHRFT